VSELSQEKLKALGLVSTNVHRIDVALKQLHLAMCQMDLEQLRVMKRTQLGRIALRLCDEYADMDQGLLKFNCYSNGLQLQHFTRPQEVCGYITYELLETLKDDLQRMESHEQQHYTDEDREEMRNKIADVEMVSPLLAIDVHTLCQDIPTHDIIGETHVCSSL
jgi:hypothetical protein